MRMRRVGSSGLVVSVVGLGCNQFGLRVDADGACDVVHAAVDAGVTLFDTAESYGDGESERYLGKALAGRREEVVIATKFGGRTGPDPPAGSRKYIRRAIAASLERLGTDYVDLYYYHRPDGVTPMEETLGALNELVREGVVRHIGSSNLSAAQVRQADAIARERGFERFIAAENRYSLLERNAEDALLPAIEELELGLVPFPPLARGLLTGKYRRGEPPPRGTRLADGGLPDDDAMWARIDALGAFAAERGLSLLDVAIGGLAAMPTVSSVIAGATSPEQVRANVAAGQWEPSAAELSELREL